MISKGQSALETYLVITITIVAVLLVIGTVIYRSETKFNPNNSNSTNSFNTDNNLTNIEQENNNPAVAQESPSPLESNGVLEIISPQQTRPK